MDPQNRGHFGTCLFVLCKDIILSGMFNALELWGGLILGPQVLSFIERFIVLCPYLEWSTVCVCITWSVSSLVLKMYA